MHIRTILVVLVSLGLRLACALPAADQTLRLGTNIWLGYEPLYVGRELYPELAGSLRLVEYRSTTQVLSALRLRAIDAGAVTLDEALQLASEGVPLDIVLVTNLSRGADVLLARPGITTMSQLRGRRVGVESTALGAYMLTRALETNGLRWADVHPVSLSVDQHAGAFLRGQVDAVVTFEPIRTHLLRHGAVPLFSTVEIPGEIVDVIVIRRDSLPRCNTALRNLGVLWDRSLRRIKSDRLTTYAIMARRLQLSPPEIETALTGLSLPDTGENQTLLAPGGIVSRVMPELVETMQSRELLRADRSFELPRLRPGLIQAESEQGWFW